MVETQCGHQGKILESQAGRKLNKSGVRHEGEISAIIGGTEGSMKGTRKETSS